MKNPTIKLTLITLVTTALKPSKVIASAGPGSILSEFNTEIELDSNLTSINSIISTILPISFTLAGIILLFMLISGGFTMMTAISDPKGADAGKQRITAALTGFFLLFLSYWIIQILEIVLGVNIFTINLAG